MARRLIYAANWKMHLGPAAAREFMQRFLQLTGPAAGTESLVLSARGIHRRGHRSRRRPA